MIRVYGQDDWWLDRDEDGYREYKIKWLLVSDNYFDGPANVHLCPDLPAVGSIWAFDNDLDLQVWCRPQMEVRPLLTGEPNRHWYVTQTFSNKPLPRCSDADPGDPLSEPPEIGGTFVKRMRELAADRHGNPLVNSAWQRIVGDLVTVEEPWPTVTITRNVATLNQYLYWTIAKTAPLNDSTLWGLPPRHVLFSNYYWSRKYQGNCAPYYSLTMEFEVGEWDRWYQDKGTVVLKTGGNPDNDDDFEIARSPTDGHTREVFLDGSGGKLAAGDPVVEVELELLDDSNLLLLGVPASL
jgi:hypothetical protein